jgi:hypothetical protein
MHNTQAKKLRSLAYNKCFVFIKYSREDGSGSRHEKFRIRQDLACNPDPVSPRFNTCLKKLKLGCVYAIFEKKTTFFSAETAAGN